MLFNTALLPLLLSLIPTSSLALTSDQARARSVYQVVTDRFAVSSSSAPACSTSARNYCGGNWAGLASKLDYIKGMGFDTVWISPIVSNIGGTTGEGQAYHGYWTLDPDNLNDKFGSESDLQNLVNQAHTKGMYIMVDVVVNHVAATSSSDFTPSDSYGPFNQTGDYHPFCWITDYTNQTSVEDCWLGDSAVALPDLNTESDTVKSYWNDWIKSTVEKYNFDAIRIDTVKHVPHSFWSDFTSAAGVFNQGEILEGDPTYVSSYQKEGGVNGFNYPQYYPLIAAFNNTGATFDSLVSYASQIKGNFSDVSLTGGFVNNHDNPRLESWVSDSVKLMNAHAYPFVSDGIPYLYYGTEVGFSGGADPDNREAMWTKGYSNGTALYTMFKNLNAARGAAGNASTGFYTSSSSLTLLTANDLLIAKPPLVSMINNRASSETASSNLTIQASASQWSANTQVIDAISCQTFTTDGSGNLVVGYDGGKPRVFIENNKKGSVCSASNSTSGNTKTGAASRGLGMSSGMTAMVGMGVGVGALVAALGMVL